MRKPLYWPQLLTVLFVTAAAAAQSPWGFPLDRNFIATSLNGKAFESKSPTLTIKHDSKQDALVGAGFAGCNRWLGRITVGQSDFGVGNIGTTRMFCSDRMTDESNFLNALKTVKRWRMDGATLVLEGDQMTLLLTPATQNNP